jgi:hypothetical protein
MMGEQAAIATSHTPLWLAAGWDVGGRLFPEAERPFVGGGAPAVLESHNFR